MNYKHTLALLPLSLCIYVALYFTVLKKPDATAQQAAATPLTTESRTQATPTPLQELMPFYFKIHASLVADNTDAVRENAQKISALAQADARQKEIVAAADELMRAGDLETSRAAYKTLSRALIAALKSSGASELNLYVLHCPMARADWIQDKAAPVENPYYGKEMLECGDVTQKL